MRSKTIASVLVVILVVLLAAGSAWYLTGDAEVESGSAAQATPDVAAESAVRDRPARNDERDRHVSEARDASRPAATPDESTTTSDPVPATTQALPFSSFSVVVLVTGPDGRPVVGASVWSRGGLYPGSTTDGSGRAKVVWTVKRELLGTSAGETDRLLHVRAPGFAGAWVRVTPSTSTPVEVPVRLGASRRLAGVVRHDDGRPGADLPVEVSEGEFELASTSEARTGPDGRFVAEDLGGGPFRLSVTAPVSTESPVARRAVLTGVRLDGPEPVLVLHRDDARSGTVEGAVLDETTGYPVTDFEIEVRSSPSPAFARALPPPRRPSASAASGGAVPTGDFRVRHVPEGTWDVVVRARDRLAQTASVQVVANETAKLTVRLARGLVVDGVVHVPDGVNPARHRIVLEPIDGDPYAPPSIDAQPSAVVGEGGTFRLTAVRPGRYRATLLAVDPKATPMRSAVDLEVAGERDGTVVLDVVVLPTGRVTVLVTDPIAPDPPPPEAPSSVRSECSLVVLDPVGRVVHVEHEIWRDLERTFDVNGGDYTFSVRWVRTPGRTPRDQRVSVIAGQDETVVIAPR